MRRKRNTVNVLTALEAYEASGASPYGKRVRTNAMTLSDNQPTRRTSWSAQVRL